MVEIYDEDTLTEFELNRQRNIIKNFEFMKACGLPVKPLIYVKRVHVPLEEQFKYLSDESSDSSDEEWTLGPKKKKKDKNEPKSADIRIKVSNPTEFFKQKKKREEEEKNGHHQEEGESSKDQKDESEKKKRNRKSKKKKVDDAQPSTSGTSTSSSASASKSTSTTKPAKNVAGQASESDGGASSVKVTAVKEKANGKQFIKERPKLPPSTLKRNNIDSSSSDEENNEEDYELADIPVVEPKLPEVPTEAASSRYPKREGQPRVNYSEAEVPDDDHYLFCAECNLYYQGECSEHCPIRPISDSTPSEGSLKARATLPEGMEIKKSGIKDAGLGVFSTMAFKSGATFGPYDGEKVRADVPKVGLDTSYMWEIVKELKVVYYINGKNEEYANWMRYVNCSRNEEEQNMIAYQFHGKIFYRVYKDVKAGTEFLVWYGEEYAGELGIALEEKPENVERGKFQLFKCDWCLICCASEDFLTKHQKYCRKKPKKTPVMVDGVLDDQSVDGSVSGSASGPHEEKKCYECHTCGKAFPVPAKLEIHLRVHTGDKPFSCQHCGKKFNHQSNLNSHMLTHTKEQPFICEVCGQQFNRAVHLRLHMRVHTGERPYECVVCGKGFKHQHHLYRHSRTHTGEKPYQCPHCEYRSAYKHHLNSHMKKKHSSEKK